MVPALAAANGAQCERGRGAALQVRSGPGVLLAQSEPAALPLRAYPLALARWLAPGGNSHALGAAGPAARPASQGHTTTAATTTAATATTTLFPRLAR
jgi:hypothetical protein